MNCEFAPVAEACPATTALLPLPQYRAQEHIHDLESHRVIVAAEQAQSREPAARTPAREPPELQRSHPPRCHPRIESVTKPAMAPGHAMQNPQHQVHRLPEAECRNPEAPPRTMVPTPPLPV